MIRSILLFAMLLLGQWTVSAQTFYIKGGANLTTVGGDQSESNDLLFAYHAGVGLESPMESLGPLELTAELYFSQLGLSSEFDADDQLRLNYLELPLMLRYTFGQSGPYLGTGFGYGVLLRANAVSDGLRARVTDDYRRSDLYIPLSIGYHLGSGFAIDLRYHYGFKDISVDRDVKEFNRAFMLSVHYFI